MLRHFTAYFALLFLAGCANQNATTVAQAPTPAANTSSMSAGTSTGTTSQSIIPAVAGGAAAGATPVAPITDLNVLVDKSKNMVSFIDNILDELEKAKTPSQSRELSLSVEQARIDFRWMVTKQEFLGQDPTAAKYAVHACDSAIVACDAKTAILEGSPMQGAKFQDIYNFGKDARNCADLCTRSAG